VLTWIGLIAAWHALASLTSALLLWIDKRRARAGGRRIPESRLHLVELAGGWPGSLWARRRLRHKTAKRPYRVTFGLIVSLHLILWAVAIGLAVSGRL